MVRLFVMLQLTVVAFDPKFVLTPTSIDIMKAQWEELAGIPAVDNNNVIYNIEWYLTGKKSAQYTFAGPGN